MTRNATIRALVAALVLAVVAAAAPAAHAVAGFGDVRRGAFHTEAVQWMVDEGLTTGTSPGCFSPDDAVTRGELATFLWREAGRPAAGSEPFSDVGPGDYHRDAVAWMVATGVTTGTSPSTFEPDRAVTRGEAAAFLWRRAGRPGVSVDGSSPACATAVAPDVAAAEAASFAALNGVRAVAGVPPVSRSSQLDAAARGWSEAMAGGGFFRHSDLGYAENIAWYSSPSLSPQDVASRFTSMWVDSPGHYRNMTDPGHTVVGVGLARSGSGWHATHVFG